MKKILKITGYVSGGILVGLYAAFLFVLPNIIHLDKYVPQIQKIVKDNTGLDLNIEGVKIYTTPLLEAGIKTSAADVKLPDNSVLFKADELRAKVFLPALLWRQILVSEIKVSSPDLDAEILDGEQYKAVRVYENLVNSKRQDRLNHPEKYKDQPETKSSFDFSKIKLTLPNIKLNNYNIVVNDPQINHKLTLKGEQLKLGYYNGKSAKLKTNAQFLSDNNTNITANLDIDTFLPPFEKQQQEEDDEAVFAVPFFNPVTEYRTYDIKSDINSKLKVRKDKKTGKIKLKGFTDIENTTLKMGDLTLPESYLKLKAKGMSLKYDTNIFVTDTEHIQSLGSINYGKKPFVDVTLQSTQVHLNNLLSILQAYLGTAHINNDIKNMKAGGYFFADAAFKTDYKTLTSSGNILIKDGKIADSSRGMLFDKINTNIYLDGNEVMVKDTGVLINGKPLEISGRIDDESFANFSVKGDELPLPVLYNVFTPKEIRNKYTLNSGTISLNSVFSGEMNDIAALIKSDINNIDFRDRAGQLILTNKNTHFGLASFDGETRGKLGNKGFSARFPKRHSALKNNEIKLDINNDKITVKPSDFIFNQNSKITVSGGATDIYSKMNARFNAVGKLSAPDMAEILLHTAIPYFDVKGNLPAAGNINITKGDKIKAVVQVAADPKNYITPVKMDDFLGKQTIVQLEIDKNKNSLKISNSGFFTRNSKIPLTNDPEKNMRNAKEIIKIRGIISNINTKPFISLIKVVIPNGTKGSFYILKKSRFSLGGNMHIYGKPENPIITGHIDVKDWSMPELLTRINRVIFDLGSKKITLRADRINANGNDFSIHAASDWEKIIGLTFTRVDVYSKYFDVNSFLKVPQAGEKAFPGKAQDVRDDSGKRPDNPVKILNGSLRFKKIVMNNLYTNNSKCRLRMYKSTVYLDDLKTYPLGGSVFGDVSYHILDNKIRAAVSGEDFDIEKVLREVLNMKNMVTGKANFIADITLSGTNINQQLKSLRGFVDFNIRNGQLGPFGKIENFLMAENIRENAFFSSAVGSVITNLVTFDTSRYNSLYGHLIFNNGVVNLAPIKSQGNVMSMYIAGKVGLLDNSGDITVRAKLASAFSDKLGPIAQINPINIVKHTPGLNIALVKTFALFCEEVSEDEMAAIPELGKGKSDENATKLQVKLRGDTRKPLKMIKSFKWLALDSDMKNAENFVDTLPTPATGEENLSVEEILQLRQQQAEQAKSEKAKIEAEQEAKKPLNKLKNILRKKTAGNETSK